jgi:hypothetical protein
LRGNYNFNTNDHRYSNLIWWTTQSDDWYNSENSTKNLDHCSIKTLKCLISSRDRDKRVSISLTKFANVTNGSQLHKCVCFAILLNYKY